MAGEVYTLCGIGLRPRAAGMRTRQREDQRAAERAGSSPQHRLHNCGFDLQVAPLLLLESRLAGMTLGLR